jgi:DNA-binding NarL/FixJ family response regulator
MHSGYIVEDHASAQKWLAAALQNAFPGISMQLASTMEEAHELLNSGYPEIALVDLNLPDGSGIEVIERLNRESPATITVVTTIYDDDEHLFPALRAGARGYILKEQRKEEISRLLRGIINGEPPLSPSISQRMIRYFAGNEVMMPMPGTSLLSEREREVLSQIALGLSLKDVAAKLGVTHNTIATQVKSIYSKLNISSRAEAALAASRMGIVDRT